MGDKLARAWTLTKGEGAVANEPLYDVCVDLINYAVLLQVAHDQRRGGQVTSITLNPTPEQVQDIVGLSDSDVEKPDTTIYTPGVNAP